MSTKIVALPSPEIERREETVSLLKEALERAERGEIRAVAIAYVEADGQGGLAVYSVSSCHAALIGVATTLVYRMSKAAGS